MTDKYQNGSVTIPLDDYNNMRNSLAVLTDECAVYKKEIERLRSLYAELHLPPADTIDWGTINFEFCDLGRLFAEPRRKQKLSFEFVPKTYNPSNKSDY